MTSKVLRHSSVYQSANRAFIVKKDRGFSARQATAVLKMDFLPQNPAMLDFFKAILPKNNVTCALLERFAFSLRCPHQLNASQDLLVSFLEVLSRVNFVQLGRFALGRSSLTLQIAQYR